MKSLLLGVIFIGSFISVNAQQQNALQESIKRGKDIYQDFCVSCHLPNGAGVKNYYPPLAKADFLIKNRKASIHAIKFGISGEIQVNGVTYNGDMAEMGLYDDEIADVMNYITNQWGNSNKKMITKEEVSNIKK